MSNDLKSDITIIGAGVIGLAIARSLATQYLPNTSILVLEACNQAGLHTSTRNSGVIHAGIYYPTNSLKAKLCVKGKHLLYRYCAERSISHKKIGKFIVAKAHQKDQLHALWQQAKNNGVDDLIWLETEALKQKEPNVSGDCALFSPSTGIIDSAEYLLVLQADLDALGVDIAYQCQVVSIDTSQSTNRLVINNQGQTLTLESPLVINAAGLGAQTIASATNGLEQSSIPTLYPCKGHYFSLSGPSPFTHLVYPMPEPNTTGLGIHATLDTSGQVRFGPDTQYCSDDYSYQFDNIDTARDRFVNAIRNYYPHIHADNLKQKLQPDFVGIRPKIQGPKQPSCDFIIRDESDNGAHGVINLFGIESPGLTASLAIGEYVTDMVQSRYDELIHLHLK